MKKEITAFSIEQGFAWLQKELKEKEDSYPSKFIDISSVDDEDFNYLKDLLVNLGYCVGWVENNPSENPNQIQTQVIDTKYPKGDKKWKGVYLAVFDTPWGVEEVPRSRCNTKKESVDAARAVCQEQGRDAFVIMGKSPVDFQRCTAQVLYKPSPKQKPGNYIFMW